MDQTQEQIIKKYKELKRQIGRPPNIREFYSKTDITRNAAEVAFGRETFTKIQRAAGDKPRSFRTIGRSKNEFFEIYGKVIRESKGIPTTPDWKHRKVKPTIDGYRAKLKIKWSQMPVAFIKWASDKSGWEDVVDICTKYCEQSKLYSDNSDSVRTNCGYVYLIKANKKGRYKIGATGSIGRRASQLSQLDTYDRRYEHVLETTDPFGLENYWKRRFKEKSVRSGKEIFQLSQEDLQAFKQFYVKKVSKLH
jgi:hypothetical protein